jgi:hypothetical protein
LIVNAATAGNPVKTARNPLKAAVRRNTCNIFAKIYFKYQICTECIRLQKLVWRKELATTKAKGPLRGLSTLAKG